MKFFGEPNQLVRFTRKNMRNGRKIGFRFDDKGEYVTENKRLIQALKTRFKYEDDKLPMDEFESTLETIVDDSTTNVEVEEIEVEVKEEIVEVKKSKKAKGGK